MTKIVALIYADSRIPAEIYSEVHRMQSAGALDLIDVTEVEIKDNGKLKFEQDMAIPLLGSSNGLFLPAFIGLIFFHPHHMANARVQDALQDISLDPQFISVMTREVAPRNSILFLHVRNQRTEPVIRAMTEHGGRAVEITLTDRQEDMLRRLFKGQSLPDPQFSLHI